MKNKLILLLTLAITSSLQAISFRDYYRAHEKEVNAAVAGGNLDLDRKNLTDLEGFDEIPNITNLRILDLYNNQLTSIPATLGNLTNLHTLALSNNQLTSIPATLGNLTNLQLLWLNNNQLTTIPANLGNLTNLQLLWLYNNQLTTIPANLGNLTNLRRLSLSNNQLTSIPATLGNLTNLQKLWLNNNQLTSIPATLGNLTNLQELWLNNNQLTSIPATLGNLTNLQELFLSDNPIPLNTMQLQTKLHLGPDVQLLFKTPAQEQAEHALINAIKTADEPAVRRSFKDIMTGAVKAPFNNKINITAIRDSAGNNLLHMVVVALADKIKSINNNKSLNEGKKAVARNWAEKTYTKIFFGLAQFHGPAQRMLLTTNKNGDTVLVRAIGLFGPNSEFVQAIRQYEHVPTPANEFATQFKTTSRRPIAEETEEKEKKEIQADVIQAMKEMEKEQAAQRPRIINPAKRAAALRALGLKPTQDDPKVIQQTFKKLAVQYKPSNIPPDAPLDMRTKIIEEYKALENARNYLLHP